MQRKIVVTDEKSFQDRKNKVLDQLDQLDKHTKKGKINESVGHKLKTELEEELKKIDFEFHSRLSQEFQEIRDELQTMSLMEEQLKSKQKDLLNQKEELEARNRIRLVEKKEYREKCKVVNNQLAQVRVDIEAAVARTKRLEMRLEAIKLLRKAEDEDKEESQSQ